MKKFKTIKYLFFLPLLSLTISACQSSTSTEINSNFSSTIIQNASSNPQIELTSGNNTAIMTMDNPSSEVITKKDQTTFKNIAPNTDAIYKKIENGIKEEIILHQKPASPPTYTYLIDVANLKPQFFQGQYYFFDNEGYSRFTIPRPFMIDSRGKRSEAVGISISNNTITLTPDHNWLIDQERQYPITIDPSLIIPDSPIRELADHRTISGKTYDLGNGKFAATSGLKPLHYQDSTGKWQDIDTTIVPSSDPEYNFMNQTNSYQSYFSTDGFGQKKAVKFQVKDAWMKFKIVSASGTGQKNQVEANKFDFNQIIKNGDNTMAANYTLEENRLLEEVVLNKFQGFPEIKQEIELHNAVLKPNGKKINAYHSTTNELLWIIPEPVMYELNSPNKNYGLHYEINCTNPDCSNLILSKVIDPEGEAWLSDPARIYPLVIDTTAGPNNPGTAVSGVLGDCTWIDPTDVFTSNNYSAYCNYAMIPATGISTALEATNFSFSIPTSTTIDGIMSEAEMSSSLAGYTIGYTVVLIKSDGTYQLPTKSGSISGVDTYYSNGNSSDLWSGTWTSADINSSNFGAAYRVDHCDPGSCSLHPDSLIFTPFGNKKISDLHIGDPIFSYNENRKKIEIKTIENVISHPISINNNRYFYIYYQNKIIKATENHRFYVNGSYLRADQLSIGDKLLGLDLKPHPIKKIKIIKNATDTVWDLTVEDNHNFFVEGILTHNMRDISIPANSHKIDHIRLTVYYTDIVPAIQIEGVKMEGIKIN